MTRAEALKLAEDTVERMAPQRNERGYPVDRLPTLTERATQVLAIAAYLLAADVEPTALAAERADTRWHRVEVVNVGDQHLAAGYCPKCETIAFRTRATTWAEQPSCIGHDVRDLAWADFQ